MARRPSRLVVATIALAAVGAAVSTFALALTSDHVREPGLQASLMVWITFPSVIGGLVAWWRRPDSRFGPLMITAGFLLSLSNLQWTDADLPHTIGTAFDLVPAAVFLHLFLAYPSGRIERPLDRALVVVAYFSAVVLQFAGMLLGGFGPNNLLEVVPLGSTAKTLLQVQLVVLSACALTGAALLGWRTRAGRRARPWSHAFLMDSFALALIMIAVLFTTGAFSGPGFETIRRVTLVMLGLAPIAFLSGLLRARLARAAVGDFVIELQTASGPADVRDALARALRDDSLALVYWLPEYGTYADLEGGQVSLSAEARGRSIRVIERDGIKVAAMLHDPSVEDEPELLESVTAAAEIALENARLHAELRARLEELRGSRARVIEAGQKERQRLERNLHDGAQQRLIALSLELSLLEEQLDADPDAQHRLDQARQEIAVSLEELRAVAHGIHPAVLSGHGLGVALETIAAGAAVPVRLSVELESRLQERFEVAAYYVVSEGLANIGKHAQATSASVDVARVNGHVVVEVIDDGVGGANTEDGSGLRGLADRVEALGGRLRVWTPPSGGTRVRADIPCA